jgi:hypothetical protein
MIGQPEPQSGVVGLIDSVRWVSVAKLQKNPHIIALCYKNCQL